MSYFESKNNIIRINLNYSNNYCLYSSEQRFSLYKIAINHLLFTFFLCYLFSLYQHVKNLNAMLYNYI